MSLSNMAKRRRHTASKKAAASKASMPKVGALLSSVVDAPEDSSERRLVELSRVRSDGGTQSRVALDTSLIEDYTELMSVDEATGKVVNPSEEAWPAIKLVDDSENLWLADGFHRVHAARAAGIESFQALVTKGTLRDAILESTTVNTTHGKRRTRADIARALKTLLSDDEWGGRSNRWIGQMCSVSDMTVGKHRKRLEESRAIPFRTSIERAGKPGVYDTRTPPRALDDDGYLVAVAADTPPAPPSKKSSDPATARSVSSGFEALGPLDGGAVVAFPLCAADCDALVAAIEVPPSLVVVPYSVDTPMAHEAPARLSALVDTHGMEGPRSVYVEAHHRIYHVWFCGEGPSIALKTTRALLGDHPPTLIGHTLGDWTSESS